MTTIANNLCTLMKRFGISSMELARQTGIGQTVIHRLANNQTSNPKIDTLRPIAKFFSLSISQLVGEEDLNKPPIHSVPIIPWNQLPSWRNAIETQSSLEYAITDYSPFNALIATEIEDHTMEPKFPIGSTLFIDTQGEPRDHLYVLVHKPVQQQVIFRQLLSDGEIKYLKPLNTDFKMQRLLADDQLIGVMVQAKIK